MALYRLGDDAPQIPATAFVAPEATLIGKVILGENTSVWFGAVIRGDNEPIVIGEGSNVQECAVLHNDLGFPLTIGAHVTVGHQAVVHGCTVGDGSLIGIQAVLMNGAVIGRNCLVAAGSVVTERKVFPDRSLILGAPAKLVRELTDAEIAGLAESAADYSHRRARYKRELARIA
ncbi:MAG: gamma carbonic anhydrase family protein [Betaproteobacteria bacterium]|nr:MAG: gamma carbonic anhydrase family protein [Betaproteobacteria bacterium]